MLQLFYPIIIENMLREVLLHILIPGINVLGILVTVAFQNETKESCSSASYIYQTTKAKEGQQCSVSKLTRASIASFVSLNGTGNLLAVAH